MTTKPDPIRFRAMLKSTVITGAVVELTLSASLTEDVMQLVRAARPDVFSVLILAESAPESRDAA